MANVNLGIQVLWTGDNIEANLEGVEGHLEQLTRAVDRLGDTFERMRARSNRATDATGLGFKKLGRDMAQIVRSARLVQIAFVGIMAGGLATLGGALIEASGKYAQFIAQLTITEGTAAAATAKLSEMASTFVNMGANIEAGIGLFTRLRLAGVPAAQELSVAISGLSATMGLTTEQVNRVTLAITQMFSKGQFVRAEEFSQQLQETLPLATAAAAEGFRMMGNTALDSVNEISQAVRAGTLRVTDFYQAVIQGSTAFINQAAAITNVKTQWQGFTQILAIAVGATGQLNGYTAAFAIVLNAASRTILEWVNSFQQLSLEQKAAQVTQITSNIIDFIRGIETTIRVLVALGNLFTGFFRMVWNGFQMILVPIAGVGMALAALVTGNVQDIGRIVTATQRAMGQVGRDFLGGWDQAMRGAGQLIDRSTPIADALERQVSQMNIPQLLADAANSPGGLSGQGQGQTAANAANAAAQRRANRLIELQENLIRLNEELEQTTRQALSPLEAAAAAARDPMDELANRFTDLRTDFEALGQQGVPVGQSIQVITQSISALSAAAADAEARARRLYEAQNALANLKNQAAINEVGNNVRELVESVTVRFEGEGAEQIRNAEIRLQQTREANAIRIAELSAQMMEAENANNQDEVARLESLIQAHVDYQGRLESTTGAMIVAAQRMQALIANIRNSVENALSDLIQGLVGTKEFNFEEWANGLVSNITAAIADSWAKKATDMIFDFLGIGSQQQVGTMNVQNMNVLGGVGAGGAGGGGLGGLLGSLFGGGSGGGGGGFFGSIMSFIGGFFAKGGVRGMMSGPLAGSITPFANGGITGGPTLFGLAGEKGKEGILPLERIGGKLGVNAINGGGVNASIIIQAIDTQTGAMFIRQNMPQIVGELNAQMSLGTYRK